MDPRLLRLYSDELTHLRERGGEFAREFPKIAARLSMDGVEVTDPYVERLLEGFAFLTARIQLKLEAEYPRLVQHLLEAVYPNFLAPIPSMMIAQLVPDAADPNLAQGALVRRGSTLRSELPRGQNTLCEFRTAHEVQLWPVAIASAQYFSYAPDLPIARLPGGNRVKGGLRIRLRALGGARFSDLALDRLPVHFSGAESVAYRLHELALGACLGSWVGPAQGGVPEAGWRSVASVQPVGYGDDEALLPRTQRGFSGYRLLQEYAALPQRFLGVAIVDLHARLAAVEGSEVEIVLLFSRGDAALESLVDAACLALFCTPAINLFPKRLDRIVLTPANWEHHAVPDRTRPMDFEVHSIDSVTGFGTGAVAEQRFLPMYANLHTESRPHGAYYTLRREPRVLSASQKAHGPRSAYVGQEAFLALVDANQAPYREDLRQIAITAWCTNRDLPNLLPGSGTGAGGWTLDASGTVAKVRCIAGPTRPLQRQSDGDIGWSLVSQLSLNYLSIAGDDPARAAAALRSVLALYGPAHDIGWAKQLEGLNSVQARQVVRRLPLKGPLTFGTGIEITASVDDLAFQGGSAFLLGCLLERFFARHVALNTFSETVLRTAARGEVMRWPARLGDQALA